MSESNDQDGGKGRLSLRPAGRLELGRTVDAGSVRQSFSHGRSKVVQVEVRKKRVPPSAGTFPTHTPLFVVLVIGVIVIVGALTFLPSLALGPIVEQLKILH